MAKDRENVDFEEKETKEGGERERERAIINETKEKETKKKREREEEVERGLTRDLALNMARAALIREGVSAYTQPGTQKPRGRWTGPIQEVKNALKKLPPI